MGAEICLLMLWPDAAAFRAADGKLWLPLPLGLQQLGTLVPMTTKNLPCCRRSRRRR
jgi:hypothetical protein